MVYQSNGLRDAFEGQGAAGFFAYTYATFDPLEEVLAEGYFNGSRQLAVGDLIFVGTRPRPATSARSAAQKKAETRRALLMVAEQGDWGRVAVRLVQDYGRPTDPSAPLAKPKRGPGRPPKPPAATPRSTPASTSTPPSTPASASTPASTPASTLASTPAAPPPPTPAA